MCFPPGVRETFYYGGIRTQKSFEHRPAICWSRKECVYLVHNSKKKLTASRQQSMQHGQQDSVNVWHKEYI
jgi:hypothetical protein